MAKARKKDGNNATISEKAARARQRLRETQRVAPPGRKRQAAAAAEPETVAATQPSAESADLSRVAAGMMAQGEFRQAAEVLGKLVDQNPADAAGYHALSQCLVKLGQLDKARKAQELAVHLDRQVAEYQAELAKIMVMQGDFNGARQAIEKLMPLVAPEGRRQLEPLLQLCVRHGGGAAPEAEPARQQGQARVPKAPVLEITDQPLNILFVQEAPCIRNYKTATALRTRGHRVTLAYSKARLSQMYKGLSDSVYNECIQIKQYRDLWDLSAKYDIVHCHNEPDVLTVAALAGDAPVIHDTHDLISLRANGDQNLAFFEGTANRGAHGRVYTTPYQRDAAAQLYGAKEPSLVFYNYTSAGDLPKRMLPKLSASDGKVHIVYEGGIGGNGHRDFIDLFIQLAGRGIHVHILPAGYNPEMAKFFAAYPEIHYNHPLSPKEIMEAMSQFDIGIIPFNIDKGNKRFLDSTIANKLFEYMAAGLPVVASPLQSYVDYFAQNKVGCVFNNADDIVRAIPEMLKIAQETDLSAYVKTYEGEVLRLEAFYRQVIADYRRKGQATGASMDRQDAGRGEAPGFGGLFAPAQAQAGKPTVDYSGGEMAWFGEEASSF